MWAIIPLFNPLEKWCWYESICGTLWLLQQVDEELSMVLPAAFADARSVPKLTEEDKSYHLQMPYCYLTEIYSGLRLIDEERENLNIPLFAYQVGLISGTTISSQTAQHDSINCNTQCFPKWAMIWQVILLLSAQGYFYNWEKTKPNIL